MAVTPYFFYNYDEVIRMDSIYRDAYPDIFATFDDDYESVKVDLLTVWLSENVDQDES